MRYYWNVPSENSDIKHAKNKREVKPYGTGQSFHWTLLLRSQFSADVTPISELHLPGEVRHRERTHARDVHYTYINGSKFKSQVSLSLNKVQNKSTCTIPTFDQKLCYKCSEFCFFFFFLVSSPFSSFNLTFPWTNRKGWSQWFDYKSSISGFVVQ